MAFLTEWAVCHVACNVYVLHFRLVLVVYAADRNATDPSTISQTRTTTVSQGGNMYLTVKAGILPLYTKKHSQPTPSPKAK